MLKQADKDNGEVTDGLIKPVEDVLEQLDELGNDLEIYRTSTRMDTEFFM